MLLQQLQNPLFKPRYILDQTCSTCLISATSAVPIPSDQRKAWARKTTSILNPTGVLKPASLPHSLNSLKSTSLPGPDTRPTRTPQRQLGVLPPKKAPNSSAETRTPPPKHISTKQSLTPSRAQPPCSSKITKSIADLSTPERTHLRANAEQPEKYDAGTAPQRNPIRDAQWTNDVFEADSPGRPLPLNEVIEEADFWSCTQCGMKNLPTNGECSNCEEEL
jgi:hypothetical protein